jgi:hypothetical protein
MKQKKDVRQGTLALMVLKTLDVLGPLHGYGAGSKEKRHSVNGFGSRNESCSQYTV